MKDLVFIVLFIAAIIVIPGCKQKPEKISQTPQKSVPELKTDDFISPEDSSISVERMKAWLSCNPLLDSLTLMYADSFKTKDPDLRMRYQGVFSSAQNKICVLAGLSGGYKEYKWILQNLGVPKNKPVLDSVNAGVY